MNCLLSRGVKMTAIVGIRCKDGVVIGADSSATFGDGGNLRTMEQPTEHKIEIIENALIMAGTGYVGYTQRLEAVLRKLYEQRAFQGKTDVDLGKVISAAAIADFNQTGAMNRPLMFSAVVAFPAGNKPALVELPGGNMQFQPEIKRANDLWFTSMGSGQMITDPFLALLRQVYWPDGPPSLQGGIFSALWALQHACDINPGGVKEPVKIAVMSIEQGKPRARMLSEDELAEHRAMVDAATKHMASFRDILEGKEGAAPSPDPA